jgi:hypothetical protein
VVVIQEAEAIPEEAIAEAILEQTVVVISETQELPHTSEPTQEQLLCRIPETYTHTRRESPAQEDRTRNVENRNAHKRKLSSKTSSCKGPARKRIDFVYT